MKTIAIAALLLPNAPIMPEAAPLQPSGKWTVEYADSRCVLSRDFGLGDERITVGFNPSPLGNGVEVVTLKQGPTPAKYRQIAAKLSLQPSGKTADGTVAIYGITTRNTTMTTFNAEDELASDLMTSQIVTLEIAGKSRQSFAVRGMPYAFQALKTCQAELVKSWGIDPTERDRMKTLSKGNPSTWITYDDYPSSALSQNEQGTSVIVWTIGTDGRPSQCRTVLSSKSKDLDNAACFAISRRARYSPALGLDGKPMISHQMRRVVWRLPE